jgi:hypothetical protein
MPVRTEPKLSGNSRAAGRFPGDTDEGLTEIIDLLRAVVYAMLFLLRL